MEIEKTFIEGLLLVKPRVFTDARGFFLETYNELRYHEAGICQHFIQDNMSYSSYGVVRGLHFQQPPHAQAKLVSVEQGRVWDVAVDLRRLSPTFGRWYGVELTDENHWQFLIPRGMAHGFAVLSETAFFTYKCDNLYAPDSEGGILFNDPTLNIDWKIPPEHMILSDKDMHHPLLDDVKILF